MNVHDRDLFMINWQFESNQCRIRINNIMMKETKEELTKTVEQVSRDRLYMTDTVMVRILKARRTVQHTKSSQQFSNWLKCQRRLKT